MPQIPLCYALDVGTPLAIDGERATVIQLIGPDDEPPQIAVVEFADGSTAQIDLDGYWAERPRLH